MSETKSDPKPCPTCGHCPTCGQTAKPAQPQLVPMPYPVPWQPSWPYSPVGDPPFGEPWKPGTPVTCKPMTISIGDPPNPYGNVGLTITEPFNVRIDNGSLGFGMVFRSSSSVH